MPAEPDLAVTVLGGYEGTVAELGPDRVRLALATGGSLEVRYGERVRIDGELVVLGRPPSPHADAAEAALKAWRSDRSKADRVPAYVVLSDRHLAGIAQRDPEDLAALRGCPGIGPAKLESYGEEILAVLASVRGERPDGT